MNRLGQVAFCICFIFFSIGVIVFFLYWFTNNEDDTSMIFFIFGIIFLFIFIASDDLLDLIMNAIQKN